MLELNSLDNFGTFLKNHKELQHIKNVMIFTNKKIAKLYFRTINLSLFNNGIMCSKHEIPDGDKNKNLKQFGLCHKALLNSFGDKLNSTLVVNLGGGMISDLGGFVAATAHRGIPFVNIPTTLLSAVDASIGGKVGINFNGGKNLIGSFHLPKFIYFDKETLMTLSDKELACGKAEVVKYAFIYDKSLLKNDLLKFKHGQINEIVKKCYDMKSYICNADLYDKNIRMILNFGHTLGHAFEMASDYKMSHGEAVACGMIGEVLYNTFPRSNDDFNYSDVYYLLKQTLKECGLPTNPKQWNLKLKDIMAAIKLDKKNIDGKIRMVVPKKIGEYEIIEIEDTKDLESIIKEII